MYATFIWSLCGALAFLLALAFGSMWLLQRKGSREYASLTLSSLGLATAVAAYCELGMMHARTAAEYGEWFRWYHVPLFFIILSLLLFVRAYLGTGRLWLLWVILVGRVIILIANFSLDPSINLASIDSLRQVSLLGERVSMIAAATPRSEWQLFATATLFLLLAYLLDAAIRRWLEGGKTAKRDALAVGLGLALPMLCAIVYAQAIIWDLVDGPLTNLAWFLGALLTMGFEFGRYMILNSRAQLQMAELRNQMAQTERLSLLGQLASALAHELAQPLMAISTNVIAAQKQLDNVGLTDEAVRGSLRDIGSDERRASEVLVRMRQLFKNRAIEMRPLKLGDVVDDVFALVDAQAQAKQIALHTIVEPGVPTVLGDRLHLSQVLLNLLVNGIQAVENGPRNERRVEVRARVNGDPNEVELVVSDSGPGIAESIADEIFSPLVTTKPDGMGVGLAIARSIVEAHGGRLWAERAQALGGAAFHLTLRAA